MRNASTVILLLLLAPFAARDAAASAIWTPNGEPARERTTRAFVALEDGVETLVEEIDIETSAPRFVVIRAFPAVPQQVRSAELTFFDTLAAETRTERPHRDRIHDVLFGPSVLTLLTRSFLAEETNTSTASELTSSSRRIYLAERGPAFFQGKSWTSTITFKRYLPNELETWFEVNDVDPSDAERIQLASLMDTGWAVMGVAVENPTGGSVTLGPTIYRFPADAPVHPLQIDLTSALVPIEAHYWLALPEPSLPNGLDAYWDRRPWTRYEGDRDRTFVVAYNSKLDPFVSNDIQRMLEIDLSDDLTLLQGSTRVGVRPGGAAIVFKPSQRSVSLPGADKRGSPIDVLITMLLGLTPLLYTPESWFLLWIGLRARNNYRRKAPAIGVSWWPLFSLATAMFWFARMEGIGRTAALIPLFIGIKQLATPVERERGQIRIDFSRRKKKGEAGEKEKPAGKSGFKAAAQARAKADEADKAEKEKLAERVAAEKDKAVEPKGKKAEPKAT